MIIAINHRIIPRQWERSFVRGRRKVEKKKNLARKIVIGRLSSEGVTLVKIFDFYSCKSLYLIFVTYNKIYKKLKRDCFEESWTHRVISLSFTHSVNFLQRTPRVKVFSVLAILSLGNLVVFTHFGVQNCYASKCEGEKIDKYEV